MKGGLTTSLAPECRAFSGALKIEKLKAPLIPGPEGAVDTNDWCITRQPELSKSYGTGVRPGILKPTPIIYLAFEKYDLFVYFIVHNVDIFICYPLILYILSKKKKRPMHFSMRLSKSTLFSDIARYIYYVTDIHPMDGRTNEETDVLMEKLTDIYQCMRVVPS